MTVGSKLNCLHQMHIAFSCSYSIRPAHIENLDSTEVKLPSRPNLNIPRKKLESGITLRILNLQILTFFSTMAKNGSTRETNVVSQLWEWGFKSC